MLYEVYTFIDVYQELVFAEKNMSRHTDNLKMCANKLVVQKPDHLWPGEIKNYYGDYTTSFDSAAANSPTYRQAAVAVLAAVKIAAFCCRSTRSQLAT